MYMHTVYPYIRFVILFSMAHFTRHSTVHRRTPYAGTMRWKMLRAEQQTCIHRCTQRSGKLRVEVL